MHNMETEFNNVMMGEKITLSGNWENIAITLEQPDTDIRHRTLGDNQNPSTVTMKRTNLNKTTISFHKDSIIAVNEIQIRYNINDVMSNQIRIK